MVVFEYSRVDFLFTCLGLVFLLLDIGLDIFAAVSFYQEKEYVSLGILTLFLLGSSVLVQAYSWLWYRYEDFRRETKVEGCLSRCQLMLFHVLQLGIYFRHAGVMEISVLSFFTSRDYPSDVAVYLSHDLSMLRLIETFSESSPQFVLMLTIILQRVLKALGSASAIALTVTTYHRSLRSFLPKKENQQFFSSVVYFFWNLFLILPRLIALALFASVQPCFIFTHFICSWLVLFFFAWRSKTDFMECPCGEWLYRATVGLIWYFAWFNVVEGRTRYRTLFYHGYILADVSLLCGLWYWKMSTEPPDFEIPHSYAIITAVSVVALYIFGLIIKMIYYKCYHPNLAKGELKGVTTESQTGDSLPMMMMALYSEDVVDMAVFKNGLPYQPVAMMRHIDTDLADRNLPSPSLSPTAPSTERCNKRMRKLAETFYS
ncbi:XK-related protein 8-like isoform X2 [Toxotes jaculatrix]|uniref:XK-related protein 8-like isoform X2 n=1 Tax=Toxotes jaculatrix TaxID=941984 RepID=UPI001B3AA6EC|nr:XK-related protein 8-like isoform X2 [Toxotes jaculatrix]